MRNRDRVIIFLASKASKCAALEEIKDMLERAQALNSKDDKRKRHQVIKLLYKMAKRGDIKRSWISWGGRRKRIYCLRWSLYEE